MTSHHKLVGLFAVFFALGPTAYGEIQLSCEEDHYAPGDQVVCFAELHEEPDHKMSGEWVLEFRQNGQPVKRQTVVSIGSDQQFSLDYRIPKTTSPQASFQFVVRNKTKGQHDKAFMKVPFGVKKT